MKNIYSYLAYVAVLAMLFTSCSKDEATTSPTDDPAVSSVDITFGAMLNDLTNRAMSQNKSHFDQVPDCSDAEPAIARIGFSYGGNSYETDVAILSDEDGYFTDYSEDLKIPVPNNGSVEITLDSFMVYDGDPDGDGELIWIAPIESEGGEFDGYVDTALPFSFEVQDGTKPYIDVEVLCFDRRMVNEYGYVFFDILPEVIYPLCLFVNYCDENGRHYVADYSVDLYFGTDDTGIQLYDHTEESAMAMTGDYGEGMYYADPLCLVVPGPPANLASNQPYLYLVIYPEDWDGTGDIDNTPTEGIQLTWDMVSGYLNEDGETNEYHHVLIGECEDAIGRGDGGGNGGTECNPSDPEADCDDDGVLNECDTDNANWAGFDCDGDGIANGQENQGCVDDPDPDCGVTTGCDSDFDNDGLCDNEDPDIDNDGILNDSDQCDNTTLGALIDGNGCSICDSPELAYLNGEEAYVAVTPTSYPLELSDQTEVGNILFSTTGSGDIEVLIGLEATSIYDIIGYEINISQDGSGTVYSEIMMITPALTTGVLLFDVPDEFDETSFSAQIEVILCPADL